MFSIVIPLYDKARQVSATLDSIRRQTFAAYEVVIIDDASTDGSPDVVRNYLEQAGDWAQQVRLILQEHAGVSAARNRGIQESRNEWIAFLDADDVWAADYLQTQYELTQQCPSCDVLGAAYWIVYSEERILPASISKLPFEGNSGILANYFEVAACSHPPLTTMMTIVRKKAIEEIGGFPEGIGSGEDLLTWARLALRYAIGYSNRCLGFYMQNPAQWNEDQKRRMPERLDVVGGKLEELLRQYPEVKGLRAYIASWFKMRVRIYLSHSMRSAGWREWKKMVRYAPFSYKTWTYLLLLASPMKMMK